MAPQRFDVVVVGAGIVGTSIAFRLAERGQRVALIEAHLAGSGVSSKSFAWFNSEEKHPDAYHRLNAAGVVEYRTLAEDAPGVDVHRTGALRWPEEVDDYDALETRRRRLVEFGYPVRWLDRGEIERLEPNLRLPVAATRALFYEDDGWVDPQQVISALLDAAGDRITLVEGAPVEEVFRSGEAVTGVRARGERFECDSLVVAAGTGTPALAELVRATIPVQQWPGLVVVTTPVPEGTLQRVVHHRASDIRPDVSDGIRISAEGTSGRGELNAPQVAPEDVLARTAEVLPALESARVARVLMGVRPIPKDRVTIAGLLPGTSNGWVAVTHSGVTLGPLLGRLIASEVCGGEPDPLLADFRPERFATT